MVVNSLKLPEIFIPAHSAPIKLSSVSASQLISASSWLKIAQIVNNIVEVLLPTITRFSYEADTFSILPFIILIIFSHLAQAVAPAKFKTHKMSHLLVEQLLHLGKHAFQLLQGDLVVHHPASLGTCWESLKKQINNKPNLF